MQNLHCYFFILSMNLLFVMLRGEWPIPDAEYDDTFEYTDYDGDIHPTWIKADSTESSKDETTTLSPKEMPVIDTSLVTNVTAHLGYTAILPCRTKNLKDDQVFWIRHPTGRFRIILTIGLESVSSGRFQVVQENGTDDWALRINFVQKSDEGAYECRWIGKTDNGILDIHNDMVNLEVTVDTVDIIGEREIHVDQGSEISLVCVFGNGLYGGVVWYHNEMLISNGEYCKVLTDIGEGKRNSQLLIQSATPSHSGNYSCTSFNGTERDTVQVFVSTDGASNLNPCLLLLMAAIPILRLVEMVSNSLYL